MGACCSFTPHGNKVAPLDKEGPKKVNDNFVRGRGDGESDAEKSKDRSSPTLDRYVSGSSFSSKSCASKSVDELDVSDEKLGEDDIFGYLNIKNYDVLSERNSEIKTEGGLTDVSLDLDHPFAPSYKDDPGKLNVNELSRPRSKGFRGRSSYTRDLLSQLSNYSDMEYTGDIPAREDTPVPGKRSGSNMSILSKRKHKRKGNLTSRSRKSILSGMGLDDGDNNSNSSSTPRSLHNSTPGGISASSSIVIKTDDGGSSLTSSCASLSAIGEMSESSSVRSSVKRKETNRSSKNSITSQNNKIKTKKIADDKENKRPIPAPRRSKMPTPRSADILSKEEKDPDLTTPTPRSADLLLGGRQDTILSRSLDNFNMEYNNSKVLRSSNRSSNKSTSSSQKQKPSTNAWPGSPLPEFRKNTLSNIQPERSTTVLSGPGSARPLVTPRSAKPLSSYMFNHPIGVSLFGEEQCNGGRPMAARPRRPATAVESLLMDKNFDRKYGSHGISEDLSSGDDGSAEDDSSSHPVKDDRFKTIIII